MELQVTGLAEHTTWALGLLAEEVDQMRKVVLQDRMALDILTAAQGGTCAVVHTECCVYIADNEKNVIQALSALVTEIDGIQRLRGDPYKSGGLISFPWRWVVALAGGIACLLAVFCCSLYCCCGLWVQGSVLLTRWILGARTLAPLGLLAGEEPLRGGV